MSSDSSDDENLEHLREAVDAQFFTNSLYKEKQGDPAIELVQLNKTKLPPSLRKQQDEDEQLNLFRVTPEFQNYVAKHLSNSLEKQLQKVLKSVKKDIPKRKAQISGGVKLLSNSGRFLKVDKKSSLNCSGLERAQLVRKKVLNYSKEIDKTLLKTVVVEPEYILSKEDTKFWSTRSKAPVFNYKKTSEGNLVLIEPTFK